MSLDQVLDPIGQILYRCILLRDTMHFLFVCFGRLRLVEMQKMATTIFRQRAPAQIFSIFRHTALRQCCRGVWNKPSGRNISNSIDSLPVLNNIHHESSARQMERWNIKILRRSCALALHHRVHYTTLYTTFGFGH